MEVIIGAVFWGGLLILVLVWIGRGTRRRGPTRGQAPEPAAPPDGRERQVNDALVDSLVIGHYLTRDHYRTRLDDLESDAEGLRAAQDPWFGAHMDVGKEIGFGNEDLDFAEFDAMGGFGVEPWAENLFDDDD